LLVKPDEDFLQPCSMDQIEYNLPLLYNFQPPVCHLVSGAAVISGMLKYIAVPAF